MAYLNNLLVGVGRGGKRNAGGAHTVIGTMNISGRAREAIPKRANDSDVNRFSSRKRKRDMPEKMQKTKTGNIL